MSGREPQPALLSGPAVPEATPYWEARAQRFARQGAGLAAVCSYGMPEFHNRAIDLTQRLALQRWLRPAAGSRVLDLGCGVGRWSLGLARQGAQVTGIDLSRTMVEEAGRRARAAGVEGRCRFRTGDIRTLEIDGEFDLIVAVTVLQHLLAPGAVGEALTGISRRLAPGGRVVLLEAAPGAAVSSCDNPVFRGRTAAFYLDEAERAGLRCRHLGGVDPAPFRRWLLPRYGALRRPLGLAALALATALGLPIDLLAGRRLSARSWHKVFVLESAGGR